MVAPEALERLRPSRAQKRMLEAILIADDFTGAADGGIAFTLSGLPAAVTFAIEEPRPGQRQDAGAATGTPSLPAARAIAVDARSRALPPAEAAGRAHAAALQACRLRPRALYRKIDSTLRGNAGPELAATLRAAREVHGRALLVFSPAFPAAGRTLRGGRVRVHGVPLEETEVWRESGMRGPAEPAAILVCAGVKARSVRPGEIARAATEAEALVCDAETEQELEQIARAGAALKDAVVWAGSGGLARHLPAALGLRSSPERLEGGGRAQTSGGRAQGRRPVLVLVGSRSSVAREQARLLLQEPGVEALALDVPMLMEGGGAPGWSRAAAALRRALDAGRDALLFVDHAPGGGPSRAFDSAAGAREAAVAAGLGRLAAAEAGRLAAVIATGGDTARAALDAMGATGLFLLGEMEPGVPFGEVVPGGGQRPLRLIAKAGAFGDARTLIRCRAALQE